MNQNKHKSRFKSEKHSTSSKNQKNRRNYNFRKKSTKDQKETSLTGIVKRHPGGFGFVIPEKSNVPDVYIPASKMGSALSDDRVEVFLTGRDTRRFYGYIKKILKRHWRTVSGPYEILNDKKVLKNHGLGYGQPIELANPLNLSLKRGDWIKVKITHYPESQLSFKGDIIQNLGVITTVPEDDSIRILAKHNIALEFSKEVLMEAEKVPVSVSEKDFQKRIDLRSKAFVTIDGATAKDFDDSIFVESLPEGFRLFTAIADVSHYVREGSILDKEAFSRGNSAYLPNLVSPMLPEKLSNHICSLNPHAPRLVLTAEMEFDLSGNMTKSSFYEAVIESQRRFTYAEAQEIIDEESLLEKFASLKAAKKLADILIKKQVAEGALDFNLPETVIKVNSQGMPLDIMRGHRLFSHRLIEQFMLAANKAAALFLKNKGYHFIYRVHDSPNKEKLEQLEIFSKNIGYTGDLHSRKGLLSLLIQFKNHPKEPLINKLVLRAMAQACYSPSNKGHYGIHAPFYTHFTSPIRRYCDLMIHRLLKKAIFEKISPKNINRKELETQGVFISEREQAAVKAERQVYDIKKARFLKNRLGENFEGTVSSVTSFGLFITLKDYDIEGLVRFKDLPGHWILDEVYLRAVASRSRYSINFGDDVKVRLDSVDEINGRIDFHFLKHKDKDLPKSERADFQRKRSKKITRKKKPHISKRF